MRVQPVHDARVFTPMVDVPSKLAVRHAIVYLYCFHQFILNEGLPGVVHTCHFVILTHVFIYDNGALFGNDGVVHFVPPGDTLLVVAPFWPSVAGFLGIWIIHCVIFENRDGSRKRFQTRKKVTSIVVTA